MTKPCSTLVLHSTLVFLLCAGGAACGTVPPPPPNEEASGTTGGVADSSTGNAGSATSTTGGPPATSSSTTSDGPSSSGGTSDDTSGTFIFVPDGGICVFEGAPDGFQPRCSYCDVGVQDCPPGEKCVPWANDGGDAWNATRCSEIPKNPAGLGEPCVAEESPVSGMDDCDLGMLCFGVDPRTLQGTCTALCDSNEPSSCGADEVCVDYDYFQPHVCLSRCDPLDPASCSAEATCRSIGEDLLCVPTVTLPQGLECGVDDQYCGEDQACVLADALASCDDPQCCRPWCDLSAPDPDLPCAAVPGEVCQPFFDAPPAGYEHVGVCRLPV